MTAARTSASHRPCLQLSQCTQRHLFMYLFFHIFPIFCLVSTMMTWWRYRRGWRWQWQAWGQVRQVRNKIGWWRGWPQWNPQCFRTHQHGSSMIQLVYVPGLLLLSCPGPGSLTERADYCIECWRFAGDFQTSTCLEHTPSIYHCFTTRFQAPAPTLWQLELISALLGNMDSSLTGRCPRPLCAPGLFHQGPCAWGKVSHRYVIIIMMYFSSLFFGLT